MEAKAQLGALPTGCVKEYNAKIDDALEMIRTVHDADSLPDPADRKWALEGLGDEILRRNQMIFFFGVANQAFPINRRIGGRWFDQLGWSFEDLEGVGRGLGENSNVQ
jgi:hypothetical protein